MANKFISTLFKSGAEFETFLKSLKTFMENVKSGTLSVPKATSATKATQDGNGKEISTTYAKINDLINGGLELPSANRTLVAAKAESIITTNGSILKIFVGTQAQYDALTDAEKENLFAIISDDATKTTFESAIKTLTQNLSSLKSDLKDGSFVVKSATNATSATTAGSANSATSATKATNDGSGNNIESTYAKKDDLTSGAITVNKAITASSTTWASSAGMVSAKSQTVSLTWSDGIASGNVNLDANSAYLITIADGAAGLYLTFVLHVIEKQSTSTSCTKLNKHNMLFYNHSTKKLHLRRYCYYADGGENVGYIDADGGTEIVTYTKIANIT